MTFVRVVLDASVVWMTMKGSEGARRLLSFFCGAGFVVSLFMLVDAHAPTSLVLTGSLVECAFAFFVFTFSADAKLYLDSKA